MWPVGRTIKIRVFRVIRVIRDSDNEHLHPPINFWFLFDTCRPAGAMAPGPQPAFNPLDYRERFLYLSPFILDVRNYMLVDLKTQVELMNTRLLELGGYL